MKKFIALITSATIFVSLSLSMSHANTSVELIAPTTVEAGKTFLVKFSGFKSFESEVVYNFKATGISAISLTNFNIVAKLLTIVPTPYEATAYVYRLDAKDKDGKPSEVDNEVSFNLLVPKIETESYFAYEMTTKKEAKVTIIVTKNNYERTVLYSKELSIKAN